MVDTIKQSNLLNMVNTAQKPTVATATQSSPQPSQTITNTIKESRPDQFIKTTATGAATGAIAGGFVGAFAFAKPMFNSLNDLLDAPMDKIKQYQNKTKNSFIMNALTDIKTLMEEEKEALFKGKDSLSVDTLKSMTDSITEIYTSEKIDGIMQKIKENCNNKEMTIGEFNNQIKTILIESISKKPQDMEALADKLKSFEIPMDMDFKVFINDEVLETMQTSMKFSTEKLQETNKLYGALIDNAKDGMVMKSDFEKVFSIKEAFKKSLTDGAKLVEKLGASEAGEMTIDEIMKTFDNEIKKMSPKSRMKPAIIGAAVLAVVGGSMAAIMSKTKKNKS